MLGKQKYCIKPMEQRTKFADRYLEKFEFLDESSDLYPLFQSYLTCRNAEGGVNISSSRSVAWRYLLAWDAIIDVLPF